MQMYRKERKYKIKVSNSVIFLMQNGLLSFWNEILLELVGEMQQIWFLLFQQRELIHFTDCTFETFETILDMLELFVILLYPF